jgi:hypothetical protein
MKKAPVVDRGRGNHEGFLFFRCSHLLSARLCGTQPGGRPGSSAGQQLFACCWLHRRDLQLRDSTGLSPDSPLSLPIRGHRHQGWIFVLNCTDIVNQDTSFVNSKFVFLEKCFFLLVTLALDDAPFLFTGQGLKALPQGLYLFHEQ